MRKSAASLVESGVLIWYFGVLTVVSAISSNTASYAAEALPANQPTESNPCRVCHAAEVDGFARSKMAHSMRLADQEPPGIVQLPGTTITMTSDKQGSWQSLTTQGGTQSYRVDYVVGSGTHASGYITRLDGHLFQSPVAFYSSRGKYDLAPGYEKVSDPDFDRPIERGCVFCHAGSFDAKAGTVNEYASSPFPKLAVSCERCHGPTAAHLADPGRQTIVNPARLEAAARDSVCEQCHLIGVARVLNPQKQFPDFHAGRPLEETFTIYHNEVPKDPKTEFRVISHVEQLALSRCKRESGDRMWCGTCHDPHNEPTDAVSYYRAKCLQCHANTTTAADHPAKTSDCIGCHMPKRQTTDGGHTAFTDHRIQARRSSTSTTQTVATAPAIVPWREPPTDFAARNLGIASIRVGLQRNEWSQVVSGYAMLARLNLQFPQDSEMFTTMGSALLAGQKYREAVRAFELAVKYDPTSSSKEANLGQAYAGAGQTADAEPHLEKSLELDRLNLTAAGLLMRLYEQTGQVAKAEELSKRLASLVEHNAQLK
jgi:Flp pilus assembly protein TadD